MVRSFKIRFPILRLTLFLVSAAALFGQTEAALRDSFEGQYVTVKIDMPATKDGVDIYPFADRPLDLQRYANRIKASGTSLKRGDSVMVTLLKVNKKNIEVQLGGGGFGTFGDDTGSTVTPTSSSKTKREKDLEEERKNVTDKEKKKDIDRELRDLRNRREREDARSRAEAGQAEEARKARVRQQAMEGGSRFNIWFSDGIPADMLSPDAIRRVLAEYLEFPGASSASRAEPGDANVPKAAGFSAAQPQGLRKGMTAEEVSAALGQPESCMERAEGALKVTTCHYRGNEAQVDGQFVDGVLLRYTIASQ